MKGARIMGAAKAFIRHEAHKTKAIVKREQRCARAQFGAQFGAIQRNSLTPSARPARLRMRSRKSVLLAPHAPSFPRVHEVLSNFRKKNKEAEDARATEAALVGGRRAAAAAGLRLRARAAAAVVVVKGDAPRLVVVLVRRRAAPRCSWCRRR